MASFLRVTALVAGILSLINGVNAGAEANVYGCIYTRNAPSHQIPVTFIPGGSTAECMYTTGNVAYLDVVKAGVSCVSIGFISGKSSSSGGDFCATTPSRWRLSYNVGDEYSGFGLTDWSAPIIGQDTVKLVDYSPLTQLCNQPGQCGTTSQSFRGTPNLYIIFTLGASFSEKAVEKQVEGEFESKGEGDVNEAGM